MVRSIKNHLQQYEPINQTLNGIPIYRYRKKVWLGIPDINAKPPYNYVAFYRISDQTLSEHYPHIAIFHRTPYRTYDWADKLASFLKENFKTSTYSVSKVPATENSDRLDTCIHFMNLCDKNYLLLVF